jgi:lipoate-protein ligase B
MGLMPVKRNLLVFRLQTPIDYNEAYSLQKRFWAHRVQGQAEDTLLILEHTPSFTIGKSGKLENLLSTREELAREGIALFFTDRGGDITYHGPGQLVVYPIIDLKNYGRDIQRYVHSLEEVVIQTLADFSIKAGRDDKHVGVWVGDEKIAAIGISVRRWITMHGLALNVNPRLEHFSLIHPCGILDKGVTSIVRVLARTVPIDDVVEKLISHFAEIFNNSIKWDSVDSPGEV